MITRILPKTEWHKLTESGLPELLRHVNATDADVVVVEENGKVIGTLGLVKLMHFEGVWIAPEKRHGYVLGRLLHGAEQLAMERGETCALGAAMDDDERMDDLIRRRGGVPLPIKVYAMPLGVN